MFFVFLFDLTREGRMGDMYLLFEFQNLLPVFFRKGFVNLAREYW